MRMFEHKLMAVAIAAVAFLVSGVKLGIGSDGKPSVAELLSTTRTIVGEPIVYPQGEGKITAAIVTMPPGQETAWHTHGVPLAGLILEGELTVEYKDKGSRTYRAGEAVAEAIGVPHRGRNSGAGPLRFFVVYMGAQGRPTTLPAKAN